MFKPHPKQIEFFNQEETLVYWGGAYPQRATGAIMPEQIKAPVNIQSRENPVELQMGIRSDGCFILVFNKEIRDLVFTRQEALSLRQALDLYLGTSSIIVP